MYLLHFEFLANSDALAFILLLLFLCYLPTDTFTNINVIN